MKLFNEKLINPKIQHENRMNARATSIPSLHRDVYYKNKEDSELISILNGDFKFFYASFDNIENFYFTDFDDANWNTIDVPSMWQYCGYGAPTYPNITYAIPFNPPLVPIDNPVGYYRKKFMAKKAPNSILHFAGVDNAFFVYLNGEYVGFSKGSRLPAEFDVSDKIIDGENLLCVKVFTYSDATYLENQDMLLTNGIFRDVMIYSLNDVYVYDYEITTKNNSVIFDLTLNGNDFTDYSVSVEADGISSSLPAEKTLHFEIELSDVKRWNAETPNLYNTYITLSKGENIIEIHSKKIGFMKSRVCGNKLLVNDTPITIKGINRHEHDCKNGKSISVSFIENELCTIKENNMNAIRTAHYPNHPAFYELCSELGIYVMDEGDIETHGCTRTGDQGYLSKHPDWLHAFLDRTERICERNKNETCIIIRSVGNEHGRGENIDECIRYIKRRFGDVPTFHTVDDAHNPEVCDFRQDGYFKMESITSFPEKGKPVLVSEYGHAMGNSPGLMKDSWDYIYKNRHIVGGFLWEYKGHGFYATDDEGNEFYKYGGEFGDYNHWSNFTIDGYCRCDGSAKPALSDCKNVLCPCYVEFIDGKITVLNTNDFKPLDYINVKWELCEDYTVIRNGSFALPAVNPYETCDLDIDLSISNEVAGAKYFVNLHFYDGEFELASKQVLIKEVAKTAFSGKKPSAIVCENGFITNVNGENFNIRFEKGILCYYEANKKVLINAPMKLNFFRAPTDNDGVLGVAERKVAMWRATYLNHFEFYPETVNHTEDVDCIVVHATGKVMPEGLYVGFKVELTYRIYSDGLVLIEYNGTPYGKMCEVLPRIGVCFEMKKDFETAKWYGRGIDENYPDRKAHCNFGLYELPVEDLNFKYDIPQECGSREDISFATVKSQNSALTIIGADSFAFSYHNFTLENLTSARHSNELKVSDKNYLYIDYKMRGLGSNSCGPDPEECYELRPHSFNFVFALCGEADTENILKLSRHNFCAKTEKLSDTYVYVPKSEVRSVIECEINM